MAKNRKNQPAAVRFGPAVKALLFCLFIGGSGVGYVWQKGQITSLGTEITQREKKLEDLQRQNKLRRDHLAYLRSPQMLERRVKELNLGLVPPQPEQVVRLADVPQGTSEVARESRYAGRGVTGTATR